MHNYLDLLARILISVLFLINGYFKIINYDVTIEWMESYNIAGYLLIPTIILEITAPILIIIGYKTKIAATLLGLFCLSTAFIFHLEFSNNMQVTSFLKNVALSGGFLFIMINGAKKFSFDEMRKK